MKTDLGEVLRGFVLGPEPEGMAASGLWQFFREWPDDELDVLGELAAALEAGRRVYGSLDLAVDQRNFLQEAGQGTACAPNGRKRW